MKQDFWKKQQQQQQKIEEQVTSSNSGFYIGKGSCVFLLSY